MTGLTERQAQLLGVVLQHTRQHGYGPTLREVGAAMSIRSTNGVNDHRRALVRKGCLRDDATEQARCGFLLTEKGIALALAWLGEEFPEGGVLAALGVEGLRSPSPAAERPKPSAKLPPWPVDLVAATSEHAGILRHLARGNVAWCMPGGVLAIAPAELSATWRCE